MAATMSSPWAKPGAWALEAEEHDAAELEQAKIEATTTTTQPLADFPSLSAAAVVKTKKKAKPQKLSLAELASYGGPKPAHSEPVGLTHEDRMSLPTGPRERTAEELDRSRGFRSYGGGGGDREESSSKWGSQRRERTEASDRDAPSRADEADDWGAGKRSIGGNGFERKERVGFGFGSNSKADESDSWVSNKSSFSSIRSGGGGGFERERKVGFASGGSGGADSDSWGRKREESNGWFDRERKVGLGFGYSGGADGDSWGRRREESNGGDGGTESTGRPKLNLQPRTLPVTLPPPPPPVVSNESSPLVAPEIVPKPRSSNPFGAARPREEVLAEKGQDWKKIDEQLESVKLKEKEAVAAEGESFAKRSFGMGNGRSGDRTEGAWRKPFVAEAEGEARPQSAGNDESRSSDAEEPKPENESENVSEN